MTDNVSRITAIDKKNLALFFIQSLFDKVIIIHLRFGISPTVFGGLANQTVSAVLLTMQMCSTVGFWHA